MEWGPAGGMVLDVVIAGGGDMREGVVGVVEVSGLVGTAWAEGIGPRIELVVKVISPGWRLMFGK